MEDPASFREAPTAFAPQVLPPGDRRIAKVLSRLGAALPWLHWHAQGQPGGAAASQAFEQALRELAHG